MTPLRILGLDPGSVVTGWGLIDGSSRSPRLVEAGDLRLGSRLPFPDRLARLRDDLDRLLERLAPGEVAVEASFQGVNARSSILLAHARGVILAGVASREIPIREYAPALVKSSVTGNGRADKEQVRRMVGRLLGTAPDRLGGADAADALAVALCHGTARTLGSLR